MKHWKLLAILCLLLALVCCFVACDLGGGDKTGDGDKDSNTDNTTQECAHEYTDTVTAPTCTTGGYTIHKCSKCGDEKKDTEVAATGHKFEEVRTEATCKAEGKITNKCTVCDKEENVGKIAKLAHEYESTSSTSCKCKNCNSTYSWSTSLELEYDEIREDGDVIGYEIVECTNETYPNDVKIPAFYNGKPVLAIGNRVFNEEGNTKRDRIMTVVIPATVTSLGDGVFNWCRNLESVSVPNSIKFIGSNPFGGTKYETAQTKYTDAGGEHTKSFIINGIYMINACVEHGSTEYTVPEGIQVIAKNAFSINELSLETITLPKSLKYLSEYAFESCRDLETLNIHKGLIAINGDPLGSHNNNHLAFKNLRFEGTQAEWNAIENISSFSYLTKLQYNQKIVAENN